MCVCVCLFSAPGFIVVDQLELLPVPKLGVLLPPPAGQSYALQEIIPLYLGKDCKCVAVEI